MARERNPSVTDTQPQGSAPKSASPKSASSRPASRHSVPPEAGRQWGMRALAASIARVAKPALRRRGLAAGRVVADWPEIVGAELAAQCLPERLVSDGPGHGATGPGGAKRGGVLHIRVAGPLATELQHLEPLVIEKINTYFGYRAVERLRLIQGPMPDRPPRPAPAEPARDSTMGEADRAEIEARLGTMADGALRAALGRLGRAVAGRGTVGRGSAGRDSADGNSRETSGSDNEPPARR